MYEYKSLEGVSYEDIHKAFGKAFADYVVPFNMSLEDLVYMIERRGFDSTISFGAFYNDELVGFTLNGIGQWNGNLTAYDSGTGVVKEHRKKGLAKQIFIESIPVLKDKNVEQYLLEVIDSNTPAIDLYKKMGFEETRRFDFQISAIDKLKLQDSDNETQIRIAENINWEKIKKFWDNSPSWQNSIDSIKRKEKSFVFCIAEKENSVIGYGVLQKKSGDVPQLAVSGKYRKQKIASAILKKLGEYSESGNLRFINSIQTDIQMRSFLDAIGMKKEGGQLEMIKFL